MEDKHLVEIFTVVYQVPCYKNEFKNCAFDVIFRDLRLSDKTSY